ncbi:MAG TPA: PTS system mannose/fructose/sorbose family transporter subunit IID, partial [Bacillota bacterium]|nr:PTS system mannose/fructose/sorbose family transporter subunit IID [Bacillota bacterium]
MAALTGLFIGDFATGIKVGALIQLVFFGVFIVGAAVPPRPMVATIMAVIFASKLGVEHGAVLGMAVPIAVFSLMLFLSNISIMSFFYERFARQAAKTGNLKKLELWHAILQPINITLINAIPAFLGVYFGVPLVGKVLNAIPAWLSGGFGTMQGILPVAGFALLVYTMNPGPMILLFAAGYAIGTVTQLTPMATALVVIALVFFYMKTRGGQNSLEPAMVAAGEGVSKIPLSFGDRISLAWRNFTWYYNASFEVLGGWGFAYQLVPFLRRYKTDEERAEAMTRNIAFWNTNVYAGGVIPGMVAAMEAQRAENNEAIDGNAIQALKVATMGPVAGIGDSLYHATLVPIILAIGTNMVLDGNSFGWFFSVFGLIALFAASVYYLVGLGYNLGVDALNRMRGVVDTVAEGAKYVGLILVGTMVANLVKVNLGITYTTGEQ